MSPELENKIPDEEASGYVPEIQLDTPSDAAIEPQEPEVPTESPEEPPAESLPAEPQPESEYDYDPSDIDSRLAALGITPAQDESEYFQSSAPDTEPSLAATAVLAAEPKPDSRLKKAWRERKVFIILSSLFLLLAIGIIGVISYVYLIIKPYEDYNYILPNVYCAGVDLGGMTRKEAQAAIEEALRYPSYTVTVNLSDGSSYEFCPEQEGVTLNGAIIAEKAYNYMRTDTSAYGMYKAYFAAKRTEYQLNAETDLQYSVEDIEALAQTIHEETYIEATASTASNDTENHTVSVTLGTPGRTIDPEIIVEAVTKAFDDMVFDDISLEYEPVEIDFVALWDLCKESEDAYNTEPVDPVNTANEETHSIEVLMGMPGYSFKSSDLYMLAKENAESGEYGTVTLDMTETLPAEVYVVEEYKLLACEPTEPYYYNGDVVEGSNGYDINWEEAIAAIQAASWGETVILPMTVTEPEKTAAEVRAVLFRDELGSYSSPHTAIANRTTNLTLACKAINGTVINPGETFSFNGVVGERTASKGYKEATVYVGTESVGELGGGICQVASTIYNAALYADLEITTRAPHIFFVTYVKGGLDATVYWGAQDFCFRNNTEYPIRVNASVSGGYVHISIDGTKTNDNYVVLKSVHLSTTPYSTEYVNDNTMAAGTQKETVSPYTGYVYEAYQYVYSGNGTLLESNYLGKSTYQKRNQVITVGTKSSGSSSSSGSSGNSSGSGSTTPAPETSTQPSTAPETTTPETTTPSTDTPAE